MFEESFFRRAGNIAKIEIFHYIKVKVGHEQKKNNNYEYIFIIMYLIVMGT